jgi:hypothetical protein
MSRTKLVVVPRYEGEDMSAVQAYLDDGYTLDHVVERGTALLHYFTKQFDEPAYPSPERPLRLRLVSSGTEAWPQPVVFNYAGCTEWDDTQDLLRAVAVRAAQHGITTWLIDAVLQEWDYRSNSWEPFELEPF